MRDIARVFFPWNCHFGPLELIIAGPYVFQTQEYNRISLKYEQVQIKLNKVLRRNFKFALLVCNDCYVNILLIEHQFVSLKYMELLQFTQIFDQELLNSSSDPVSVFLNW